MFPLLCSSISSNSCTLITHNEVQPFRSCSEFRFYFTMFNSQVDFVKLTFFCLKNGITRKENVCHCCSLFSVLLISSLLDLLVVLCWAAIPSGYYVPTYTLHTKKSRGGLEKQTGSGFTNPTCTKLY